jgi:hypothetical protein
MSAPAPTIPVAPKRTTFTSLLSCERPMIFAAPDVYTYDSLVLVLLTTPFPLDSTGIFATPCADGLNTSELWCKHQ